MRPSTASPAIITPHIAESRSFYVKYLGAKLIFDCGWFINLEFAPGLLVQFMEPLEGMRAVDTTGLTYNFCVEDVDAEYRRFIELGLAPEGEPEDHPWGDRGFTLRDPNGVSLYFYTDIEPAPEFAGAFL